MSGTYLSPGSVLQGRWLIERELGRGGYSVVYLAYDRELDSQVALKLLVPPPAAARVARERMRREVQVVRGLSHENIVAVYDFVDAEPWSFILMEYVAGPDLHLRVQEQGPLSADQVVRLGRDLAAALGTAHRRGIVHRDVKPQNVLLDPDGRYRLTDFGSARLDGQLGVTATGALAGTPDYTAPEVLAGRRGDARADLYALGLTLRFALTGLLPDRPAESGAPAGPEWLVEVVTRAMAPSAENRYPTAAALDLALIGSADETMAATPKCMLCDGPDPLGTGLCPACGGGDGGDSLVFLQPAGRANGRVLEGRVASVLPALAADAGAASRGERPLLAATREGARRVVDELGHRQLPARAVPRSSVLTALPAAFYLMLLAVVVVGIAAGLQSAPPLLWITPIFAGLLLASAGRRAATPLISGRTRPRELPRELERRMITTLARLPPGTARSLLADITRLGQTIFGQLRRGGDSRGAAPILTELLVASSDAAIDLADLDASLSRFEQQRDRLAARPAAWLDALARCERTRDGLVQRLLEAMTVLGKLQGQTADLGEAQAGLSESVAELRAEAEARSAAAAEIEALLNPTSERM